MTAEQRATKSHYAKMKRLEKVVTSCEKEQAWIYKRISAGLWVDPKHEASDRERYDQYQVIKDRATRQINDILRLELAT